MYKIAKPTNMYKMAKPRSLLQFARTLRNAESGLIRAGQGLQAPRGSEEVLK